MALDLGLLGQETTGPGGLSYGLRTSRSRSRSPRESRPLAPDAWVINFTNPAGMITEAMQAVLGDRVVGICDSPIGLARRAAQASGSSPAEATVDYVGLNHLGWLRGVHADGRDMLPELLADDARLGSIEEGRLFGLDWVRTLGAIPNEYLYYYYFTRDAIAPITGGGQTRGEYLLGPAGAASTPPLAGRPDGALREWDRRAPGAQRHLHGARPAPRARSATSTTCRAAATRAWRWR